MALGPLFIPRKDNQVVPKTSDNPELGRFLQDLYQRIHTNELAIQRWANSVPRLAAVMGTGSQVVVSTTDTGLQKPLPMDGTTNAFFPNIVASSQITIPTDGWYTLSATVQWGNPSPPGDKNGVVEVYVYKNGNVTPGNQIVSSGPIAEIQQTAPLISVSVQDFQSFSFTSVFARKDLLQPYAVNAILSTTGGDTTITSKITALSLDFLGPTPSAVQ